MAFGFPMREFLSGGKLYDILFKGFRYQSEVYFLKKVKKVLVEAFSNEDDDGMSEQSSFIQTVKMMGPLFSINSDVKVDFSHTDLQEIVDHDVLKGMNLTWD